MSAPPTLPAGRQAQGEQEQKREKGASLARGVRSLHGTSLRLRRLPLGRGGGEESSMPGALPYPACRALSSGV